MKSFPALNRQGVLVWRGHTGNLLNRVESLLCSLTEEERNKAGRYHFEVDRVRFTLTRGYLRMILGHYLQQSPVEVALEFTPYGKPLVTYPCRPEREPLRIPFTNDTTDSKESFPDRIEFNVSHSGDFFMIALSRTPVGIDIEQHRSRHHLDQIGQRFFSEPEWRYLENHEEQERVTVFYRIWTRKEAFIKGTGQGLSYPLRTFSVLKTPGEVAFLEEDEGQSLNQPKWYVQDMEAPPGYSAALATWGDKLNITQFFIEDLA